MPLRVEDIQAGKCYKTKGSMETAEKYTVLSITRGIVTFQSWTADPKRMSLRTNTGIAAFADAVLREIPCPVRDAGAKIEYFDPS